MDPNTRRSILLVANVISYAKKKNGQAYNVTKSLIKEIFFFILGGGGESYLENCAYLWKNPAYVPVRVYYYDRKWVLSPNEYETAAPWLRLPGWYGLVHA